VPDARSALSAARLTRRTALLSLGALLAGCTTATHDPSESGRVPVASGPTPAEDSSAPDPDVALAVRTVAAESSVLALVTAIGRRHHRLRPVLRSAKEVHRAHLALLSDAVPDDASPPGPTPSPADRVPADPEAALRALAQAEDRLAAEHRRSAFDAASGPFARVLASMAAAAAQQSAQRS
jgi:hypothetical protein